MDLFALLCYAEVVRCGSFTAAANRLFRSQPAVSQQVGKLERELGQPLLDRKGKTIQPTEAGKVLYELTLELLDTADDIKRRVSLHADEPAGRLVIVSNLSIIDHVLPEVLGRFHTRYRNMVLTLLSRKSEDLARILIEGKAEIGVGYLLGRSRWLTRELVGESGFSLVSARVAATGNNKKRSAEDLLQGPLVHFEAGIELRRYIERHIGLKRDTDIALELPSTDSILRYVSAGFGATILPDFALTDHIRNGDYLVQPLGARIPPLSIYGYWTRKGVLSRAAELFLEMLRNTRVSVGSAGSVSR